MSIDNKGTPCSCFVDQLLELEVVVNQTAPVGDSIVSPTPVDGNTGIVIVEEPEWLLRGTGPIISPYLIG